MIRYIKNTVYFTAFIGLFMLPFSISAQQEMSKEERIKALELVRTYLLKLRILSFRPCLYF